MQNPLNMKKGKEITQKLAANDVFGFIDQTFYEELKKQAEYLQKYHNSKPLHSTV